MHSCVTAQLDVSVSPEEAQALFARYGFDDAMPYDNFVRNLVEHPCQRDDDLPCESLLPWTRPGLVVQLHITYPVLGNK